MKRLLLLVIIISLTFASYSITRQDSLQIIQLKEQILKKLSQGKTYEYKTRKILLTPVNYTEIIPPKIDGFLNELLSLYQNAYTAKSDKYAETLMWSAWVCCQAGDIKQTAKLLDKAHTIFKKYGKGTFCGRDTLNQIFYNDVKILLEEQSGRDYIATRIAQKNVELKRRFFGDKSPVYLSSLLDLSRLYAMRLSMGKSRKYHNLGYNTYIDVIKNEFCSSSESERTRYWNKAINYINKTLDLAYRQSSKKFGNTDGQLSEAAYNSLLLSKGLLLNTSICFEQFVTNSGNLLAQKYLKYKKKRVAEGSALSEIDSLDYVILRALKDSGQEFQIPQLSITWQDVAKNLKSDDVAIEFYRTESNNYGAVIIKKGWKHPKCLKLTNIIGKHYNSSSVYKENTSVKTQKKSKIQEQNELFTQAWVECYGTDSLPGSNLTDKEMLKLFKDRPFLSATAMKLSEELALGKIREKQRLKTENFFTLNKALRDLRLDEEHTESDTDLAWIVSKAIWTDELLKYFPQTSKGRVYFAADGEMQVTGIEYLPFLDPKRVHRTDGSYYCIADIFPIYRLSSTRELTMGAQQDVGHGAAVYGGLMYSMGDSLLIYDNDRYKRDTSIDLQFAKNGKQRSIVGLYELKGSLAEADTITQIINNSIVLDFRATLHTKENGTEASFKGYDGRKTRIMHIATHGYYYNERDSAEYQDFLGSENVHPMSRSGLMMSGAETKFYGGDLPLEVEDGILTSLEISSLDLRGLDLVTLSACQTGQGDIGQDGVFGLQRGFKMASANSIMMSLWKVDDTATQAFMTSFYSDWMSGLTKHQAFENARNAIRTDSRWQSPKYWAAFILLDALD